MIEAAFWTAVAFLVGIGIANLIWKIGSPPQTTHQGGLRALSWSVVIVASLSPSLLSRNDFDEAFVRLAINFVFFGILFYVVGALLWRVSSRSSSPVQPDRDARHTRTSVPTSAPVASADGHAKSRPTIAQDTKDLLQPADNQRADIKALAQPSKNAHTDPVETKTMQTQEGKETNGAVAEWVPDLVVAPNEAPELSDANAKWAVAIQFYPDLIELHAGLSKISISLATNFQAILLAGQEFGAREKLATQMEQEFFSKYFGANQDLRDFARDLLLAKRYEAAKDLNLALRVLGPRAEAPVVIKGIRDKHPAAATELGITKTLRVIQGLDTLPRAQQEVKLREFLLSKLEYGDYAKVKTAIQAYALVMGVKLEIREAAGRGGPFGFTSEVSFEVTGRDGEKKSMGLGQFAEWVRQGC